MRSRHQLTARTVNQEKFHFSNIYVCVHIRARGTRTHTHIYKEKYYIYTHAYIYLCQFICHFIYLSICLHVCYISNSICISLSIYLSINILSTCLSIYPYTLKAHNHCISVYLESILSCQKFNSLSRPLPRLHQFI